MGIEFVWTAKALAKLRRRGLTVAEVEKAIRGGRGEAIESRDGVQEIRGLLDGG